MKPFAGFRTDARSKGSDGAREAYISPPYPVSRASTMIYYTILYYTMLYYTILILILILILYYTILYYTNNIVLRPLPEEANLSPVRSRRGRR